MAVRNSTNMVYSSFKKLDNWITFCIWSISTFSVVVLILEFFLYKYLKRKPLEEELFLYFFIATIFFYFIIILAGFYILSKIYDYKALKSSISNSVSETETYLSQTDGSGKGVVHNVHASNSSFQSSFKAEQQKYRRGNLTNSSQPQASASISSHTSSKNKQFKEFRSNSTNTKNSSNKVTFGNCKDNRYREGVEIFTEHPIFPFNKCLNEHQRRKNLHNNEAIHQQNLFQACSEQHTVGKFNQKIMKSAICNAIQKRPETSVAEANFSLPLKNSTSSYLNMKIPSNKRSNDHVIPKIVIEDVDRTILTSSTLPIPHFSRKGKFRSLTKNTLAPPEAVNRNATCSKCDSLRPILMSYNTVGLPKPVKTSSAVKSDKSILSCRVHSIKQQLNDSCNQTPVHQTQFVSHNKKCCNGESKKYIQENRKPVTNMNAQNMTPENILATIDPEFFTNGKNTNDQKYKRKI